MKVVRHRLETLVDRVSFRPGFQSRITRSYLGRPLSPRDGQKRGPIVREAWEKEVYLALGSNLGDRVDAIEDACRAIDRDPDMQIAQTSSLYETEPMYFQDQEPFLNGACRIETRLHPIELLDRLQAIENGLGRVKMIAKGPRNIDLDILLYGHQRVQTARLTIPHAMMLEREFVLKPLVDMKPGKLGVLGDESVRHFLNLVSDTKSPVYPIVPLGVGSDALRPSKPKRHTRLMSILNITPDSFSDGGVHSSTNAEALKATVRSHVVNGATIIDVGGQSSRPDAADVSAGEELARILPAIEAIKSLPEAQNVAISVDTYRATVAEAAVKAGAHIINDISAGLLDPSMLPTIARLGCTYVMMHMRGTPATMQSEENCSYPNGLIRTMGDELRDRVDAAQSAGVRRWRMILDPGLGFAKTTEQNLDILRCLEELRDTPGLHGFPWLVGSSRKSFIGKVTGVQVAKDRIWGTAATVAAAVQGGAEIVRVHDVAEMAQVLKMADRLHRT